MKIANVMQIKPLNEEAPTIDTENPVDKFSGKYHLPEITIAGVIALLALPKTMAITKKVISRAIPGLGAILQTGTTWDMATQGRWSDALLSAGLTALNIGQIFGYAAGGAPGAAALVADIAGNLYIYRIDLIKWYYEDIEGMDVSQVPNEELEAAALELINQMAIQLAEDVGNGVLDAIGMGDETTQGTVAGGDTRMGAASTGVIPGTVAGGDTRMGATSTAKPTTSATNQTTQTTAKPASTTPVTTSAPAIPAVKTATSDVAATPTPAKSTVTPPKMVPPNYDDLSFKKAFSRARALAKQIDPENPGSFSFTWKGKPYQTNIKGERFIPQSKQRQLLIPQTTAELTEGGRDELVTSLKGIWDKIGDAIKGATKGADEAGDVAGTVTKGADDVADVVGANVKALPSEHTIDGVKYTYDAATGKWINPTDIAVGGRGFAQVPENSLQGRELYQIRSPKIDAAAKAADDAAAAAASKAPETGKPTASDELQSGKMSPEARALLKSKDPAQWTVKELTDLGYTTADVPMLTNLRAIAVDIEMPVDDVIKSSWWRNWSKNTGVTASTAKPSYLVTMSSKAASLAWYGYFVGVPFYNAVTESFSLDPKDPNFKRRLTEIWTICAAEIGLGIVARYYAVSAAKGLLNRTFWKSASKWQIIGRIVNILGAGTTAYYAATSINSVDDVVNVISDILIGPIDRTPGASQRAAENPGTDPLTGETTAHNSNSIFDRAYRTGLRIANNDTVSARKFALSVVDSINRYGNKSSWYKEYPPLDEHINTAMLLARLYKKLYETTDPLQLIQLNKRVKYLVNSTDNPRLIESISHNLIGYNMLPEETTNNDFMTNITAAIAANTKGDKMGAQKALDAAKQSQPATSQDQLNQKKVLDQMARTNPGLNIPNTNQNVTEDDPMGAGNDWATTANANDPNAVGTDLLAAYNEFAAKYPAAKFLLDIVPVTGTATSIIDASQDLYNGKYGQAALDILGAIPGFKIGKYISQGLAKAIKAANVTTKTANYANATANLASNEINESPTVGDRMMLELADGRIVVAPIAELRGNGIVIELDETGNQWLEESPEHHALKIGQNDGHPLSVTANIWNAMVDQLPSDTPDGWAEVFIAMQNQTGQPARVMPRLWSQIWRQQHNALGDSLTRVDMANWAEEVGRAMDNSGLVESSLNPSNSVKLKKYLDPKDPAMLAVWMASRAGTKGIPVDKFAKAKAVQSGLPADHWWRKIKKLVQEGAVPTVPRLLAARDIEPLVHFEGDYYIVSHNDGKHLKYDLVKKVVATRDRNTPAYQHVDHLDTGLHRITKEQLRRLASVAMEADKLADGEDDTPDLPDLLGVIAQVMGRKVRKHPDALSTTVKKSDMGYVVSNLLVRHLDGTEAQDLKNALHRAGYNVSKVIINPTTILVILKTTKTTPNTAAIITATPQPDVVGGLTEGRKDFNFDENDIARIATMDDLDDAKRYAIKLITGKTRRPMTKEKIMWFTNSINDTKSVNRLVKMLYDMMLSGEGHGVIGDRYSTGKSSYRRQFDEESQRLDPKCWKGYRKQGTKIKDGVRVNNCVKVNEEINEAEYKGKSVPLNKPIRTSPSEGGKFKVYVKDPKTGNIKMVRFGDTTGLTIKRDDPERRRNFRARHNCDNPGPKTKARYWSCKMWTRKPVGQVLKGK